MKCPPPAGRGRKPAGRIHPGAKIDPSRGGDMMNRAFPRTVLLALVGAGALELVAAVSAEAGELPQLFRDDFKKGAGAWEPTDPSAWKVIETGQGMAYSQFRQSKYKPPYRSPFNFSLVKGVSVGDFILDARVQSTARDYPHRDVCLVFGYQDPS